MACQSWYSFCRKIHLNIGNKFDTWGQFVYNRPKLVIFASLFISLALCSGFLRFNIYGQSERLFYPQNSQHFKDLDRSEKYFNYYVQREEFLIMRNSSESVLTPEVFKRVLQLHQHLMSIPGFNEFCVMSKHGICVSINPLELFHSKMNSSHLYKNIEETLLNAYANHSYIMSNGHTAAVNYPQIFGNLKINMLQKKISSNILRVSYLIKFAKTKSDYKRNSKWELKMLNYLRKMRPLLAKDGMDLIFNAVRSVDDSIERNTKDNMLLINASVASMVLFCAIAMTRLGSKVKGHFLLSLCGIFCITFGIGAGFGLALLAGRPYVGFVGVLPFLVLGIGIDDMFIIVYQVDRISQHIKGAARLGEAMKNVGFTVTMTTLTDLVAFVIGTVCVFPAVRIFCVYAFLSLFFAYCMIMTLFLALLSYDMKRVENNRFDCFPWMSSSKDEKKDLIHSEKLLTAPADSFSEKLIRKYGNILMKPAVKVVVVLVALTMLAVGTYGTSKTDVSFDFKIVGNSETEHVKWIITMEENFPLGKFPIDIVLDKPVDYASIDIQREFFKLDQISNDNKYFRDKTMNWYTTFIKWKQLYNISMDFYTSLDTFLSSYQDYKGDIIFGKDGKIVASRIHVFTKDSLSWVYRKDAMLSLRRNLKRKTKLSFYAVTFSYIYSSQLSVIVQSTLTNVAICCGVILIITLPYVINPIISILLLVSFLCIIIELLGVMCFWGLSLDSITMIVMVMAIGFTVDYSCHIAHAFLISSETSPEKRIIDAMSIMGLSVLKGGLSTLAGVLVLSLSSSKLFILFFKMMITIILLGLIHGMVILPVLLTIFCRTNGFRLHEKYGVTNGTSSKNGSIKNHNDDIDISDSSKAVLIDKITAI